jgi:hypothetical protein
MFMEDLSVVSRYTAGLCGQMSCSAWVMVFRGDCDNDKLLLIGKQLIQAWFSSKTQRCEVSLITQQTLACRPVVVHPSLPGVMEYM